MRSIQEISLFTLFVAALLLLLPSCKRDRTAEPLNEAVSSFVYAYSSGTLSRGADLKVRFARAAVTEEAVGAPTEQELISLSPSVDGSSFWEDPYTLVFRPDTYLKSGTSYLATVFLNRIFDDVPREAKSFEFDFRTRELHFDLDVAGLQAPDPQDLSKQEITGTLTATDVIEVDDLGNLVEAGQNGRKLPVSWQAAGKNRFSFTIGEVERQNKAGSVQLAWNARTHDSSRSNTRDIDIPALGDFKVTRTKVFQQPQQYIALHFSDPINPEQDLNGLIRLENAGGSLSFTIDGNQVLVYPSSRIQGQQTLRVEPGIRNTQNARLAGSSRHTVTFTEAAPEVFLVGSGVIMPHTDGLYFPFEAVNLKAVEVEVFKIFHNNIQQFLQTNDLSGGYELERVGRVILQEKVALADLNPDADPNKRTRYALDLSNLIQKDPESIYQVRIGFRPSYTDYYCGDSNDEETEAALVSYNAGNGDALPDDFQSIMRGWYGIEGYYDGYTWEHREDPCYPAYYNSDRFVNRNVLVSNLGIIAKVDRQKGTYGIVTDLRTGAPVSGAELTFFDYQQQPVGSLNTDSDGFGSTSVTRTPYLAVAKYGAERGYLKLDDGMALQLSRFDVGGVQPQNGLKGYIYGERGVWRPGDSLYLHFVLEDETGELPASHPVEFELYDARGQLYERRISSENKAGIYPLHVATDSDAATGIWRASVSVGGATFSRNLPVETVKPNRLKIKLDFGGEEIRGQAGTVTGELQARWLHGAPASNLTAKVESQLRAVNTTFDNFRTYEFDDPARRFQGRPQVIFDGTLNAGGTAKFSTDLLQNNAAPGKLSASFKTRVFERGGDASIDQFSMPFSPYTAYAGVEIPTGKYNEKRLDMGEAETIRFALVDESGNPLSNRRLEVGLYRVEWRWWWDRSSDRLSDYASDNHYNALETATLTTDGNGKTQWSVQVDDWGRYMLRVCDVDGDHCSGDFFYAGYPWYDDDGMNQQEAAMLAFTSAQESYEVGQTVELRVPASADGRILLSLENGNRILDTRWEKAQTGENILRFEATADMAPTVYANVSLLQPHGQTDNDLPTRMYGVLPIQVEDPTTRLEPEIELPDVLEPEQTVTVEVSEADGRPMAYTLAIVDEGLLDLTRFDTPDPWNSFYAKEALGVRTYDVYDYLLGGFGREFDRILSIGGDGEVRRPEEQDEANRFDPVVIHRGPFMLKKGKTAKHELTIPNYVGSVRVMVVAANDGAYGNTEKTVPVRKPLMVLATLPRVLGPGERLQLPVNVFAMEEGISDVNVEVSESSGLVSIANGRSQQLNFRGTGDQMAYFDLRVNDRVGVAKFKIEAAGGGKQASQEIEIQVRNPNPYVTEVTNEILEGTQSWDQSYQSLGMPGTNTAHLEVSTLPPIDLQRHLRYLIRYPYGCLEQTLSSGFPQLYLADLTELPEDQAERIPDNIRATIDRLRRFQLSSGAFTYWPGNNQVNHWSNSYAGHFLLAAKEKGYALPPGMLNRWLDEQRKLARNWDPRQQEAGYYNHNNDQLGQAYRLYTLALADKPELGAMNRLRESKEMGLAARWRLALAYAVSGKPDIATQMVNGLQTEVRNYRETGHTYGSAIRDRAMILETLVQLDKRKEAAELVKLLAEELSSGRWFSTQELAFNLLAIGKFAASTDLNESLAFNLQINNDQAVDLTSDQPHMLLELPASEGRVRVENAGTGLLYLRIVRTGQPVAGTETAAANNLQIAVAYKDMQGSAIDPGRLEQGTDFVAEVRVTHPGQTFNTPYEELALDQIFSSGWEITNSRMSEVSYFSNTSQAEYQDIRDDRVISFFDIYPGKTQVYRVQLTAAYTGRFYLPGPSCEAMYDNRIYARNAGRWVEVVRPQAG